MNEPTFHKKLVSVMKDNQYDRFIGGKRSGKLDTKRIYKISQSSKIFKKKEERKGKHYSVSLLIDCSGSMYNCDRDKPAYEMAERLIHHLQKVGVELEIVGFNTFEHILKTYEQTHVDEKWLKDLWNKMSDLTARTGRRRVHFFDKSKKAIPSSDTELLKKLEKEEGSWDTSECQGNCDGEIIALSRERLKKRKGGKIMIILSDGRPHFDYGMDWWSYNSPGKKYSDFKPKVEAQKTIKEGIAFISVGIQTRDVFKYYPESNTSSVDELDDMYQVVVDKLQKHIKRG